MAQVTVTTLHDDFDPNVIADETVRFGIDGQDYEIDLSAQNAQGLRDLLKRYTAAARTVKTGASRPRVRTSAQRFDSATCRRWLRERGGYSPDQLPERGRIPEHLKKEYEAAGSPTSW